MEQKRALITGVTGQDGAYLAELLLEKGYEVHGLKRRASSFNSERIDHLHHELDDTRAGVRLHYGDLTDSLSLLRVIQQLSSELPVRLVPTFLGAHEIPLDYRESAARRRAYIDLVIREMIPLVARERLATFADVFCEKGVYTVDETREILTAARAAGLKLKLHADELSASGGAGIIAALNEPAPLEEESTSWRSRSTAGMLRIFSILMQT